MLNIPATCTGVIRNAIADTASFDSRNMRMRRAARKSKNANGRNSLTSGANAVG